jgi:hypothetical protein
LFLDLCGGCRFHTLPYTAEIPIRINNEYQTRVFRTKEDIWSIVDMLINEEKRKNKSQSLDVDSYYAISKQLPFFTCSNHFYSSANASLISKFFYCKEFGIPPHKGTYNEQPNKWIESSFLISNCLSKKESIAIAQKGKG